MRITVQTTVGPPPPPPVGPTAAHLAAPQLPYAGRLVTAGPRRGATAATDARARRREHRALRRRRLTAHQASATAHKLIPMEQAAAGCRDRPRDGDHTAAGDGAASRPLRGGGRRPRAASTTWYGLPARMACRRKSCLARSVVLEAQWHCKSAVAWWHAGINVPPCTCYTIRAWRRPWR